MKALFRRARTTPARHRSSVQLALETLEARDVPTASPYLVPVNAAVSTQSILTVGDSVGGYRMVGIPDGLGAFDNGDGTFTLLMNHELVNTEGFVRAHGGKGAFVSHWVIDKATLTVLSGHDQIQTILDGATSIPLTGSALNISRFCSADMPAVTAFFNPATGLGLDPAVARLFMDGEETNNGRAFAHIVSGANAGTSYTLPKFNGFGGGSWENVVANPASGDVTLVIADSDNGTGNHFNKVIVYVGTKQSTGNEIELAGLTNGTLFQIQAAVNGVNVAAESRDNALGTVSPVYEGTFTLTSGVGTTFLRPEDGAWDPNHPDDYYFVTTDRLDTLSDGVGTQVGRSRLWKLHFTDLSNPAAGGTITTLLVGTEGGNMFDNITIDTHGRIILLEDVGNAVHNGKVWMYEIANDRLVQVAMHDPARFGNIGVPATAPFNQDEESSGVIDVSSILGPGSYLLDVQAHYPINNANPNGFFNPNELVEGGQLLLLHVPLAPTLDSVQLNDGSAQRSKVNSVSVTLDGTVAAADIAAGAFTLTRAEGGTFAAVIQSVSSAAGKTTIVLGFSSSDLVGGALPDGHYTLMIDGSKIKDSLGQAADVDGDGFAGGTRNTSFQTLFGDLNGDGIVDASEVVASAHANGAHLGDADYLWFLDYNGDGVINGRDHREVALRHAAH